MREQQGAVWAELQGCVAMSYALGPGSSRRKTERPGRLPDCVVTHRSKQQQALYIQLQAFFFLGQSLWGTVSSTVPMAAWLAPPTLRQPLRSLHFPSSALGNTCACNFPKYCCPSQFKDNVGYGCIHLGVG